MRVVALVLLAASSASADVTMAASTSAEDADRAVAEIERMTEYHGAHVGYGSSAGDTWKALLRITQLEPAAAAARLRRLAYSPSVVGRMAAARGFAVVRSPEGNLTLRRLLRDGAAAPAWLGGCVGYTTRISEMARMALDRYPLDELLRPGDRVLVARVEEADLLRTLLKVERTLAGAAGGTVSMHMNRDLELPLEVKVIAFLDGDYELRTAMWWTEEDEKVVRAAISISARPKRPAP